MIFMMVIIKFSKVNIYNNRLWLKNVKLIYMYTFADRLLYVLLVKTDVVCE